MSYTTACLALNPTTGGTLHVHGNVRTEKDPETSMICGPNIIESYQPSGNPSWRKWSLDTAKTFAEFFREIAKENSSYKSEWKLELIHLEHVKSFAPHVDHLVLDIKCCPTVEL
jgi:tRNA wybutosine-synthesizing protein 2